MSDTMDPWAVHSHEDAPEEVPAPRRRAPQKPAADRAPSPPAPAQGQSNMLIPMAMSMAIPSEVKDAMQDIADAQRELIDTIIDQMGPLGEALSGLMVAQAAMAASMAEIAASQAALAEHIQQQSVDFKAQSDAMAETFERTSTWIETVEKAILAPRRVKLERGKDGTAIGAVSETTIPKKGV